MRATGSDPGTQNGVNSGTGIADYSNRSFFTAGTNVDNTTYTEPPTSNVGADYLADLRANADPCLPENLKFVPNVIYRRNVPDTLYPEYSKDDVALTAEGIWSRKFLGLVGYEKQGYGLAKANYNEMADLLLPRAVSYGAGLIDYFFRGRLKMRAVTDEDATHLRVVVENVVLSGKMICIVVFHQILAMVPLKT